MPQGIVSQQFTNDPVLPLYGEESALELPVNLAPATTFAAGTVLGCITSAAADVQTFTATGTPTGGSFTYAVYNPLNGATSNLVIPYNCTSAALQTLHNAIFGAGNTTAGGGAWPGTALTVTGAGSLLNVPIPLAVAGTNAFTGGSSPASTAAHTTTGRSAGTYAAYASGNSDGTQTPTCILKYACVTDASGRIVLGASITTGATVNALTGLHGSSRADAPAYFRGEFDVTKLTGLDATALTNGKWRLYSGAVAGPGVLRLT
jgi:hypothetical protein